MRLLQSSLFIVLAIGVAGLSACQPTWSVRLRPVDVTIAGRAQIADERRSEEKRFRFHEMAKADYQCFWGDSNTTPGRLSMLASALGSDPTFGDAGMKVRVRKFDVFHDFTGSACPRCSLAGVSYAAALAADGTAAKSGDDFLVCTLQASVEDGPYIEAVHTVSFKNRALNDFAGGDAGQVAAQACLDGAIANWLGRARNQSP